MTHQNNRRGRPLRGIAFTAVLAAVTLVSAGVVAAPASAAVPSIVGTQSGRCLDVIGNSSASGTGVDIWDCSNQLNQGWVLTSASELRAFDGTMCLDAVNNGTTAGTALDIWGCNGQANQKWTLTASGTIVGQQSGLCLDINQAATTNGTQVLLWTCNGQANQNWSVGSSSTLTVDAASAVRSVDRVGNNFLYGLSDGSTPPASIVAPIKPSEFRQPPPGSQHRPNGSTVPVGDTLKVAPTVNAVGGHILVDMADSFDGFPYDWTSWSDWYSRIDTMIAALKASSYVSTVNAWEPWNEPDWTWPSAAGSFTDGWTLTVRRIKQSDSTTPILGPSPASFNLAWMTTFLTEAKAAGTLPDVICWHELSGWQNVGGDVAAYRALETQLGISPRPISIDEYATPDEIDVPASTNHYIAQFERTGVHDAERAFWYESGTLNGLLYNGSATASYWMYKWYADQSGNVVDVTPSADQDGVASFDSGSHRLSLVFAGHAGTSTIKVTGLSGYGSTATVVLSSVPGSGRQTNVSGPTTISTQTLTVSGGAVTVPISNQSSSGAYNLVVTPN